MINMNMIKSHKRSKRKNRRKLERTKDDEEREVDSDKGKEYTHNRTVMHLPTASQLSFILNTSKMEDV